MKIFSCLGEGVLACCSRWRIASACSNCCAGRQDVCPVPCCDSTAEETQTPGDDTVSDNKVYNVLFICTDNSALSIMAEAILNKVGRGRFRAYSAGSHPKGEVHPLAIILLEHFDYPTQGLRSKDWDEFAGSKAPRMDFVLTVCDKAAGEVCPAWTGQPMTVHWGLADPAAADGSEAERMQAFREAFRVLENRIRIFTSLRIEALDRLKLQHRVDEIGRTQPQGEPATLQK